LGFVIVIALVGLAISKTLDATGVVAPVIIFGVLILGIVWYKHSQRQKRMAYLRGKYGDERVVEMILQRRFWQG
jgi:high-affinity Fe2+/Pb2+ permease